MSDTIKWLMIVSQAISNLIFGFTTPVVHVYFMSLVGPNIYSLANFIEAGLAAVVNSLLSNQKYRHYFKQFALYFLALDSILNNIWFIMLSDVLNKNISGDELTDFKVLQRSWMLWGSLIGSGIGVWINNSISIEFALILQAISTVLIAICDGYSFKKLERIAYK